MSETRAHLAKLQWHREQAAKARLDTTQVDEAIDYLQEQIACFEEGESIAKMHFARCLGQQEES